MALHVSLDESFWLLASGFLFLIPMLPAVAPAADFSPAWSARFCSRAAGGLQPGRVRLLRGARRGSRAKLYGSAYEMKGLGRGRAPPREKTADGARGEQGKQKPAPASKTRNAPRTESAHREQASSGF